MFAEPSCDQGFLAAIRAGRLALLIQQDNRADLQAIFVAQALVLRRRAAIDQNLPLASSQPVALVAALYCDMGWCNASRGSAARRLCVLLPMVNLDLPRSKRLPSAGRCDDFSQALLSQTSTAKIRPPSVAPRITSAASRAEHPLAKGNADQVEGAAAQVAADEAAQQATRHAGVATGAHALRQADEHACDRPAQRTAHQAQPGAAQHLESPLAGQAAQKTAQHAEQRSSKRRLSGALTGPLDLAAGKAQGRAHGR